MALNIVVINVWENIKVFKAKGIKRLKVERLDKKDTFGAIWI